MRAVVFPGQGAQFSGMGRDLYDTSAVAKSLFEAANDILGFSITDVMFSGTEADLKETKVTQPAVFLHSIAAFEVQNGARPVAAVAGHSLGEFTALVANGVLSFDDALRLVSQRAFAMQKACDAAPSTMAVVIGFDDAKTEQICADIPDVVIPANYNSPGQLVISGTLRGIELATAALMAAGARRVLPLKVSGAFHSPLMLSAQTELAAAIERTDFRAARCPIYQNCTALPSTDPQHIKQNLIAQLTAPVLWTQSVQKMIADGITQFSAYGPGDVLQGLIRRINSDVEIEL